LQNLESNITRPFCNLNLFELFTLIDGSEFAAVESKCGQLLERVLLYDIVIGGFNKVDVLLFALVINVLQFLDDFLALLVILGV